MIHSGLRRELSRYLPKRNIPEEVITFIEHTAEPLCVACSGGKIHKKEHFFAHNNLIGRTELIGKSRGESDSPQLSGFARLLSIL